MYKLPWYRIRESYECVLVLQYLDKYAGIWQSRGKKQHQAEMDFWIFVSQSDIFGNKFLRDGKTDSYLLEKYLLLP